MISRFGTMISLALLAALPLPDASAGNVPPVQIEVSTAVTVVPSTFRPGDRGTVTLTLHNEGPAPAGDAGSGALANFVIGPGFGLADSSQWGPFYIDWGSVEGCIATYDIIGPGPDLTFGLLFQFYFDVIPPGASLTCTFDIVFLSASFETFVSRWVYIPYIYQTDTMPGNNTAYTTFAAGAPYVAPEPVPAISVLGQVSLGLGMGLIGLWYRYGRPGRGKFTVFAR